MKKNKLQSALTLLLVLASLACYTYINTVDISDPSAEVEAKLELYEAQPQEEEPEMVLPDVQLVKKILEKSRRLLPASHSGNSGL